MRNPELAVQIVDAMVKAVDVPITVKFRKGWDDNSVNAVEYAKQMEAAGVSAIAMHGRTRMQYYSGKADWEIIRQVKEAVQVPVIGNGDIFAPEDGKAMMEQTGCDGIMLGRGALGRPWMYQQTLDYLRTGMYEPEARAGTAQKDYSASCAADLRRKRGVCGNERAAQAYCLVL